MQSHELAKKLRETAVVLESKPDVEIGTPALITSMYATKDKFIAAVRALKPGKKTQDEWHVTFIPSETMLNMKINREAVCRKIPARFECEPLLSPDEDAEMEALAQQSETPIPASEPNIEGFPS